MSSDKPLVDARLAIRGKFRLRDLEEIMIRIRDEFGITRFTLQIDKNMFDGESHEQVITLNPTEKPKILSSYQRYVSLKRKEGYTLSEAAELWQAEKQTIKETN